MFGCEGDDVESSWSLTCLTSEYISTYQYDYDIDTYHFICYYIYRSNLLHLVASNIALITSVYIAIFSIFIYFINIHICTI